MRYNPVCTSLSRLKRFIDVFSSVDLGDHNGLSMTWPNVTLKAGTKVLLSLLSESDEAWSTTVRSRDSLILDPVID